MAAHTYWRLLIRSAFSFGTATSVQELEYLDATGTDLATGGTATASSTNGTNTAAKAFDNDHTARWQSSGIPSSGAPEWLRYQFASAVDPVAIRLTLNETIRNQAPGDFDVQYSDDGSAWTTVKTFTPSWYVSSSADIIPTLSLPLVTVAGYMNWRVRVNGTQSGTPTSCTALEMHETVGGPDVTSPDQRHGLYSDWFAAPYYGFTAFDRNASTFWAAANAPPGNWLGNSMGRAVTIAEIAWTARPDSFYTQSPTSVTIQATNNGAAWTDLATVSFATWTSAGQKQTIATGILPPVTGVWNADGTGYAVFQANERDFVWLTDGFGGCTWQSSFAEIAGFRADGIGTAIWYATGNPWQTDGHGTATFNAQTRAAPTGFGADGRGTCRFAGQQAVGEECLTPDTEVPAGIPNFVY